MQNDNKFIYYKFFAYNERKENEMKRVGLVTYFKSYNYGVWLQAYATEVFLEMHGYDVEIIDYSNKYERNKLKYSYKENNRCLGYLTSFIKSVLFGKVRYYKKGFKNHIKEYYKLSKKQYTNIKQLKEVKYDVLAVGSDQVWNPEITNGIDEVFLLKFGDSKKRISIASSLGSKKLNKIDEDTLIAALAYFDAISVRENFAKDIIKKRINKEIKVLVDPTFLIERSVWINNLAKYSKYYNTEKKFILTYFVSKDKHSDRCIDLVKMYSDNFNLPVWSIQFSTYFSKGVDKKILGATISDFIALLLKAELIITDSFHGIALSVNLNCDFVACINSENPVRAQNLLSKVGLLERVNMNVKDYKNIDYTVINIVVQELRSDSQLWLLEGLEK